MRKSPNRVGLAAVFLSPQPPLSNIWTLPRHDSKNLVFIAAVQSDLCKEVEDELIWQGRHCLDYNNQGKISLPFRRIALMHTGFSPKLEKFESVEEPKKAVIQELEYSFSFPLSLAVTSEIKNLSVLWKRVSLIFKEFFSMVATGQNQIIVEGKA